MGRRNARDFYEEMLEIFKKGAIVPLDKRSKN